MHFISPLLTTLMTYYHDHDSYYSQLLQSSLKEINDLNIIPNIPNRLQAEFHTVLYQQINAERLLRERILEQRDNDNEHIQHLKLLFQESIQSSLAVSSQLLNLVQDHLDSLSSWQLLLMQCSVLIQATPTSLSEYESRGENEASQIKNLLQNHSLLKEILISGGPKESNYTRMLQIYHGILDRSHRASRAGSDENNGSNNDNIFHRLALAISLEFAKPIQIFDTQIDIDPYERYIQYESAYLNGELDPCFPCLTTWELRMVVDCNACEEEITWCRQMLRNYRPDHILDRNEQWKYCMMVKSDVRYKRPEWTPGTNKTYKQLISGGGMCGPRAWAGRMICKSFGIPTFGVRQPGHAAMSRYTPHKWFINLGGPNWYKSWWGNTNGVYFELDTLARRSPSQDYEKVLWLNCFSVLSQEVVVGSQDHQRFFNRNVLLWSELSLQQKQLLASQESSNLTTTTYNNIQDQLKNVIDKENRRNNVRTLIEEKIQQRNSPIVAEEARTFIDSTGTIHISATHLQLSNNKKCKDIIFMDSFTSTEDEPIIRRRQMHIKGNVRFEFEVKIDHTRKYQIQASVVTVHVDSKPLQLTVNHHSRRGRRNESHTMIECPYTAGMWERTKAVEIELNEGINHFTSCRQDDALGLSIKEFILTPI